VITNSALGLRRVSTIGVAFLAAALVSSASGHGGLSMEDDHCKLRFASHWMHFTGYQPDATAEREFCEDIPQTGRTIIVLDYLDDELRDLPVDFRIIRDTGDESDLESVTFFHKPAAVYPKGTLSIETAFPEPGRYVGLVTIGGETAEVSRFPFSVGSGGASEWLRIVFFGFGALGAGAALFYYSSRKS
jgi:hypothetical protein